MKFLSSILFSISLAVLIFPGCIDPTDIGSALLDDDIVNSSFTDTITIKTTTIKGDSLETHTPATTGLSSFMLGTFKSPYFGESKATFYGQVGLIRSFQDIDKPFIKPEFDGQTLDSVVLVLGLSPGSYYGLTQNQNFKVKISALDEIINVAEAQYSNTTYAVANDNDWNLESGNRHSVSVTVDSIYDYSSTTKRALIFPHARFTLPNAFGQKFLDADSTTYDNDSTLLEFFTGFQIEPTSVNQGMLAIDMLGAGNNPVAGLYFYLSTPGEETSAQYRFPFSPQRVRTVTFEHDYSSSMVKDLIDNPNTDEVFCIQGLQGLRGKIDFPYITDNAGLIVNKAELEISIMPVSHTDYEILPSAEQKFGHEIYSPVEQILVSTIDDNGQFLLIEDITLALANGNLTTSFGGTVVRGFDGEPDIYKVNLSTHVQAMIDGLQPSSIYITTNFRANNPNQTVLYGGSSTEHPVKLNLYYTDK